MSLVYSSTNRLLRIEWDLYNLIEYQGVKLIIYIDL